MTVLRSAPAHTRHRRAGAYVGGRARRPHRGATPLPPLRDDGQPIGHLSNALHVLFLPCLGGVAALGYLLGARAAAERGRCSSAPASTRA